MHTEMHFEKQKGKKKMHRKSQKMSLEIVDVDIDMYICVCIVVAVTKNEALCSLRNGYSIRRTPYTALDECQK